MLILLPAVAMAGEWRGNATADYHWFVNDGAFPGQEKTYLSAAIEPEYFTDWNDGYDLFTFKGFYRKDQYDDERSHADIRELSWLHAGDDWELTAGIGKEYWGVTESLHLVDVINQTDLVENIDGEDKLGQPMIAVSLIRDWGVLYASVLPGFRERTFQGVRGRPRFPLVIDTDNPEYESSRKEKHIDYALRYSHSIGDWDIGLSYFNGTSREPRYRITAPTVIVPVYEQINQLGVDLQAVIEEWLWKLEVINRTGQGKTFMAAVGGFEYTFVGVFDSDLDVGLISEYIYDQRDTTFNTAGAAFSGVAFQNDLVIGARITLNDAQSSEILFSLIENLDGDGRSYNLEASRRLGDSWVLSLEARGVSGVTPNSVLSSFSQDNRVRTELAYYY